MHIFELWRSLPPEYRLSDPKEVITVWRGDKLGKHITGIACTLADGNPEKVVMEKAVLGHRALMELVDQHTSDSSCSPLISVATDVRLAQFFAGTRRTDETIYEIQVPAYRILRDPTSIGAPEWPKDSEMFVIGSIASSDIKRIKQNNDNELASELVFMQNGRRYVAEGYTGRLMSTKGELNPEGIWENIASR